MQIEPILLDDRRSTNGICVFLGGNLITWSFRKQKVVIQSSTEVEYRTLASACTNIVQIHSLFTELGIFLDKPSILWCDNQGASSLASNLMFHASTNHIEINVHFVREKFLDKVFKVRYVLIKDQVANIFTKALTIPKFEFLHEKLHLGSCTQFCLREAIRRLWSNSLVLLSVSYFLC